MTSPESLSGITTIATYLYDHGTEYGFHCGNCGYDVGKLKFKVEKCPHCDPKPPVFVDTLNGITSAELDEFERFARRDDWYLHFVGSDIRRLIDAARGNRPSEIRLQPAPKDYSDVIDRLHYLFFNQDGMTPYEFRNNFRAVIDSPYLKLEAVANSNSSEIPNSWLPPETAQEGTNFIGWLSGSPDFPDMTARLYKSKGKWFWYEDDSPVKKHLIVKGWQPWPNPPKQSPSIEGGS